MKFAIRLLLLAAVLPFLAMSKKPEITVRFFAEANNMDGEKFAVPIKLQNPPREAYIEKIPSISEMYIRAVYPFEADDGTWGCVFKLDEKGRIDLEVISTERRGSSLVVFVGTKNGVHQVIDLVIDRRVTDGIISVPRGLTELEIGAITKKFPVLGKPKKK